ncbi:MAG TPA: outer membrane beta-barrel protein [Bacteroidia bacterium]|nr:outer membrane beta-barrel protein [Bacteroidia bacterium]HRH07724.1 outer membrane beta-barrel protein [Bacteroidia bacterium]
MKEERDNLENKIRNKLYSYSEEVPADLWNKIETKLQKPELGTNLDRSKLAWFAFADLLVMLLLALPFCNTSHTSPVTSALSTSQPINNNNSAISEKPTFKKHSDSHKNFGKVQSKTIHGTAKNVSLAFANSTKNSADGQSSDLPSSSVEPSNNSKTLEGLPEILLSSTVTLHSDNLKDPEKSSPTVEVTSQPFSPVTTPVDTPQMKVDTKQSPIDKSPEDSSIRSISVLDTNRHKITENMLPTAIVASPIEIAKSTKFRIEALLGPDYYFIKNRDVGIPGFSARIDSSTMYQRAFSGEVLLSYYFTKRAYLKVGFSGTSLSRKYSLQHEQEIKELYIDSVSSFYSLQDPFNAPLVIKNYDTLVIISNTKNQVTSNMQYTLIDIPLLAGYDFLLTKIRLGVYAGLRINCLFTKKGTEINPQNYTELDTKLSRDNYKNLTGIGYMIGINASYEITKSFALTISPYYQTNPSSVFSSNYALKQNWTKCGIHAGIAYYIHSKK